MKIPYKFRFLPIISTSAILAAALIMKYFSVSVSNFLPYSAVLTFAAFILMDFMQSEEKNKEKTQNP